MMINFVDEMKPKIYLVQYDEKNWAPINLRLRELEAGIQKRKHMISLRFPKANIIYPDLRHPVSSNYG